jgi:hypothetical protein
VEGLYASLEK